MRLSKCTDWLIHPLIHSDSQSSLANLPATITLTVLRFDAFRIDTIIQVWSLFDIKSTQVTLVSGQTNICSLPECLAIMALYRSCIILCDNQPSFCHVPTGIWSFEWVGHGYTTSKCTGNGSQRLSDRILTLYNLTYKCSSNWPCKRLGGTRGNVSIAPLLHNLGTRWECVVSFTLRPPYPRRRRPRCALHRRLGGPHTQSGYFGENKSRDTNVVQYAVHK